MIENNVETSHEEVREGPSEELVFGVRVLKNETCLAGVAPQMRIDPETKRS